MAEVKKRAIRIGNLTTAHDLLRELKRVYKDMRNEKIDSLEAVRMGSVLKLMLDIIETSDLQVRIEKLEAEASE